MVLYCDGKCLYCSPCSFFNAEIQFLYWEYEWKINLTFRLQKTQTTSFWASIFAIIFYCFILWFVATRHALGLIGFYILAVLWGLKNWYLYTYSTKMLSGVYAFIIFLKCCTGLITKIQYIVNDLLLQSVSCEMGLPTSDITKKLHVFIDYCQ